MTIKELETLVGMTRANIRFYEQEGLITPARQPNGYRDYSREDAEALSKIRLFRQLHLNLDTIRKLQSGELALTRALEEQLTALEADQAALDRARQVCQKLREIGASYADLDPGYWLAELERPPVPDSPRYAPPTDQYVPPRSACHPWRRYFARAIDLLICGGVWLAASVLLLRWDQRNGFWTSILNTYMEWSLLFLMEPLCLHFWGTTPGKAVFGISIRDEKGEKLTWREALLRTWQVFGQGTGYGIPFYNLWRLWKSYKVCQEGEREPWENGYLDRDGWETYDIADDKTWRCWVCIAIYILNFGLTALIMAQAMLPPHRGGLTEAEFYENYNFYVDYLEVGGNRPDWNDQWEIPNQFAFVIGMANGLEDQVSVTLTDGVVTGVTVVYRGETEDNLWLSNTSKQLALLAFAGSLPEVNCINFKPADWMDTLDRQTGWDYDLNLRGLLRVTQNTELDGFEYAADAAAVLHALEGQTAVFRQEFHIELAEKAPSSQ